MSETIETLVTRYEKGRMARRDFVMALTALVVVQPKVSGQAAAPIDVGTLNHVSIGVADVQRSVDFYQGLFGMAVKSRQGTADNVSAGGSAAVVVNLAPGPGPEFVGIYQAAESSVGHFCLGVNNFDADESMPRIEVRGVQARMRTRGELKEIFVSDPDGLLVQLTDTTFCGGSGPRGSVCRGE